jgi:hypothetical protein
MAIFMTLFTVKCTNISILNNETVYYTIIYMQSDAASRITNCLDFFQTILIWSLLYEIKLTLILDSKKSGNSTTFGTFNIFHYKFM